MKKIKLLLLTTILLFVTTGCVKVDMSFGINKDKSMDLEIIEAINSELMDSMDGSSSMLSDEDISKLKKQGFKVEEYSDDSMTGYKITRKFKNIDDLSKTKLTDSQDLNSLMEPSEEDAYLFTVKKGIIKNTYTAKFISSGNEITSSLDQYQTDSNESYEDEIIYDEQDITNNIDYSLMSGASANFVVNLPYKNISNNATSVDNDGKKLTWNLLNFDKENIEFKFYVFNFINIAIIGAIMLVIIIIIIIVINKKRKLKKALSDLNNQGTDSLSESINGLDGNQPVEQAPIVNQPVEQTPIVNQPVEQAPIMNQPVEQAPIMNQPVEQAPIVNQPVEQAPIVNQPVEQTPIVNQPVEQAPIVNQPVEQTPIVNQSVEQAPVDSVAPEFELPPTVMPTDTSIFNSTPSDTVPELVQSDVATPSEPTIQQENIPSEPTIQQENIPSEPTIQQENIPSEPTIQQENIPSEPTIQQENIPSESTIQQENIPSEPTVVNFDNNNSNNNI